MIIFACQKCSASIRVGDEMAGKRGRCPNCRESVEVPAAMPPIAAQPRPALPPTRAARAVSAMPVVDAPAWTAEDFAEPAPMPARTAASMTLRATLRKCPDCDGTVSKLAYFCPQCGTPLNSPPAEKQITFLVPSPVGQLLTVIGVLGVLFFWLLFPSVVAPDQQTFNFTIALHQILGVITCATVAIVSSAPTTVRRK